ncbi:MAG: PKD domain-containing protein [Bradymonadaceae bacterium]
MIESRKQDQRARDFGGWNLWIAGMALAVWAGCSSNPPAGPGEECVPHRTVSCTCPSGESGRRICGDDGQFSDCRCDLGSSMDAGDGTGPPPDATDGGDGNADTGIDGTDAADSSVDAADTSVDADDGSSDVDTRVPGCPAPDPPAGDRIFVGPSGSASAQGTRTDPLTVQAGVDRASRGDAVVFLNGRYTNVHVELTGKSGSNQSRLVLRADNRHRAILDSPPDAAAFAIEGGQHIRIDGFRFDDPQTRWLNLSYARDVILENLWMTNGGETGQPLRIANSRIVVLTDSLMRRSRHPTPVEIVDSELVSVTGSAFATAPDALFRMVGGLQKTAGNQNLVWGNVFHNGVGANAIFERNKSVLIERNLFTNAVDGPGADGAKMPLTGNLFIVRFNRFFRNWGTVLSSEAISKDVPSNNHFIYHNVFDRGVDKGRGEAAAFHIAGGKGGPYRTRFSHNIVGRHGREAPGSAQLRYTKVDGSGGSRIEHNVLWREGSGDPTVHVDGSEYSIAEAQASFDYHLADNQSEAPMFRDAGGFDYRLAANSPLIDSAPSLSSVDDDAGAGSGTNLPISHMPAFYTGFGTEYDCADRVRVGGSETTARVQNYDWGDVHHLELDQSVDWKPDESVNLVAAGEDPDFGAFPAGTDAAAGIAIEASASVVETGESITFEATVRGDLEPARWRWQLGDGTEACGETVRYKYREPRDYGIRLEMVDKQGRHHRAVHYVMVRDQNRDPTSFQYNRRQMKEFLCDGDAHPYTDGQSGRDQLGRADDDSFTCVENSQ